MNADVQVVEVLIKRYGLKPALQRDVSFLGHSLVGASYVRDLKKAVGFGYRAIGAYGKNGTYYSMTNNSVISLDIRNALKSKKTNLAEARLEMLTLERAQRQKFDDARRNFKPASFKKLERVIQIYKDYLITLGFYNALMRFVGDQSPQDIGISAVDWQQIGQERSEVGSFFNDIEQFLKSTCPLLSRSIGFDGDLIRSMSYNEILGLKSAGKRRIREIIREATERRKHYFYLLTDENGLSEFIVSNPDQVRYIFEKYYAVEGSGEIRGTVAFPGIVRGKVRILELSADPSVVKFKPGEIIIAVQTTPRYINVVKKAAAIVTDEGGMLSHAAIISRELKIPCITGTKTATKILKDGDIIEVDADKGRVKIIRKAE